MHYYACSGSKCVYAQKNTDPEKYAKYINAEDARKHLSILASDEYEGRETGKPGADKAANYIANEFKKLGLQAPVNGSYFLDVPLVENVFKVSSFTLNGSAQLPSGKIFMHQDQAPVPINQLMRLKLYSLVMVSAILTGMT